MLIETAHGHVFDHACPQWADRTLGGIGGHQGVLSRAEGCWTFDARDRMPQPSRATAHHVVENAPTETRAPLPRERVRSSTLFGHSIRLRKSRPLQAGTAYPNILVAGRAVFSI